MDMNVSEFRRDKKLVQQLAEEFKTNGIFKLAMEALDTDHPANHAVPGDNNDDVSATRAAIELGTTRGYSMCLGRIKLMATPVPDISDTIETTYTKEDKPKKK